MSRAKKAKTKRKASPSFSLGEVASACGAVDRGEPVSGAIRRHVSWLTLVRHQLDHGIIDGVQAQADVAHVCEMLSLVALAVEDLETAAAKAAE